MSNKAVSIFMVVMIVVLSAIDWKLDHDKRKGNTYSERFRAWANIFPPLRTIMAVTMGVLLGHWYWTITEYVNCGK